MRSAITPEASFSVQEVIDSAGTIRTLYGPFTTGELRGHQLASVEGSHVLRDISNTPLVSGLNELNRGMMADFIADFLANGSGRFGELGEAAKLGFSAFSSLRNTRESLNDIREHPGSPGSDWKRAS